MGQFDHLVNSMTSPGHLYETIAWPTISFNQRSALDGNGAPMAKSSMTQTIATMTLVVAEYDEAIAFYRDKLGFALIEDTPMGSKRWVVVAPSGGGARLLLARADGETQRAAIGNQTGGRVMGFVETNQFAVDFAAMTANGVKFLEQPRHEPYGSVVVFADLYGNKWDLIEPKR
jgi:catechol 2,3-dioxygenase-like lactoylglutathione lyase family enzyme